MLKMSNKGSALGGLIQQKSTSHPCRSPMSMLSLLDGVPHESSTVLQGLESFSIQPGSEEKNGVDDPVWDIHRFFMHSLS